MTRDEEDFEFVKGRHVALRDPRWQWTKFYTFLSVWCWLPFAEIDYTDVEGDFKAQAKIGFTSTGQSTKFFVKVFSLDYPSFCFLADLEVVARFVSMEDLIKLATDSGIALLAKHLPEINAKKAAFLKHSTKNNPRSIGDCNQIYKEATCTYYI